MKSSGASHSRVLVSLVLVTASIALPTAFPVLGDHARVIAQSSERFLLGVMRRDGVILPFAAYNGEWSLPWPASARNLELPVTLDAVPRKWWGGDPPSAWRLWRDPGPSEVRVTPTAPLVVIVGREKQLGVRTDFVSSEPAARPFELPYPKEGLAVAGEVKIESILPVSRRAAVWQNLTTSLRQDIDAAEQKAIDRIRSNAPWNHPVPKESRRNVLAQLEAWYTSTLEQPGFGLSYIEAVKKYPPAEDDDQECGLETFVSGWIHTNSRQPNPKTDLTARVTYCDRMGASYMLPLGRLRVNNRTHWIFQISSWEREWYSVVEATPGRVRFVAEFLAGWRPQF